MKDIPGFTADVTTGRASGYYYRAVRPTPGGGAIHPAQLDLTDRFPFVVPRCVLKCGFECVVDNGRLYCYRRCVWICP